jgi:hypothetical protein
VNFSAKFLTGAIAALMLSQAQAQGLYVGADVGYARTEAASESAQRLANAARSTVTYNEGVAVGRIFGGYRLAPIAAVEVGGFYSSDLEFDIAGQQNPVVTLATRGVDFSVLFNTAGAGLLDNFFIRAGGHYSSAETEVPQANFSRTQDGGGYLVGAGYDASFGGGFSVRLGYTRYGQLAGADDFDADYFSAGIKYSF